VYATAGVSGTHLYIGGQCVTPPPVGRGPHPRVGNTEEPQPGGGPGLHPYEPRPRAGAHRSISSRSTPAGPATASIGPASSAIVASGRPAIACSRPVKPRARRRTVSGAKTSVSHLKGPCAVTADPVISSTSSNVLSCVR